VERAVLQAHGRGGQAQGGLLRDVYACAERAVLLVEGYDEHEGDIGKGQLAFPAAEQDAYIAGIGCLGVDREGGGQQEQRQDQGEEGGDGLCERQVHASASFI